MGLHMKLHWSPRSPQVRKVLIVAHELALVDRIKCVRTVVDPLLPNAQLMMENPLSKIPTLVLDDGRVIYDSAVICEYLDSLAGWQLTPSLFEERLAMRRRQSLGDGFIEFLLLLRNELRRSHPSSQLVGAFETKRRAVLAALDNEAHDLFASQYSIGHVAIGSALSYLEFRFKERDWRAGHPHIARWHEKFCARASVRATEFVDDE
jgi:glutathione S-transferase